MVVPAALFLAISAGTGASRGWGIPMATDIAFAVGVLGAVRPRVGPAVGLLLLSLATVDDVGAVAVIAFAYTDDLDVRWVSAATAGLAAVAVLLGRRRRAPMALALLVGAAVYGFVVASGVHATIAGVALGLCAPMPEGERLERALRPAVEWLVLPLFALANAGVEIDGGAWSRVTLAVAVGLVAGKFVGVTGAIALATRAGGRLPEGVAPAHVAGIGALSGIGFTVALFVAGLAFDDPALEAQAKVGILVGSLVAALVGTAVLMRGARTGQFAAPGP
jgi:NhaA family Na+:H+ antiporter